MLAGLQNIIDAAPLAIINVDRDAHVVTWNPAAERLFGWGRDEVLGRPLPIVPPDRQSDFRQRFQQVLEGETVSDLEATWLRKDGACVEARVSAAAIRDGEGRVSGAVAFLADIGERVRAERMLLETETRYQTLFERNPYPMWAYDLESLRFLAVNDAAIEHYGYSRDEFLSMTIRDIRPPEEVGRLLDDVASVADGRVDPQSWNAAMWKHRKRDGTVFEVEVRSTTLSFGGWRARLVLAKDVSVERRLEDQLRHAQRMDAIGRLAGGIAHDFNNLLMVISGYAEQVQRRVDEPLKQKLVSILRATDRAATLTRQLLAFSRKEPEQSQVFSLNTVVAELEQMLRRVIGEQITLTAATDPGLWRVKADPGQVEQVLMNLVVNARDAMPSGGRLVVETKNVEIDEVYQRTHVGLRRGPYVMLSVSDTGTGMDAETQSHIFEPFFTTKGRDKGTGLGLAIVYGIVKQSGGGIEVYSHPGRGTTFKVYLPRAAGAEGQAAEGASATLLPAKGSETILLVEDEAEVRSIAREILEEQGYTVVEALDGPGAVALARECHPHLLLTDMVLERGTGRDLAREISAIDPRMKVLFMSGYTDGALKSQGGIEEDASFLSKPFTIETLLRKVREILDR